MPNFSCPSCKKVLKLGDGMTGKTVRCPACQQTFVVPKEEAVMQSGITPPAPPPAAAAAAEQEPPRHEPEPRGGDEDQPVKKKKKFGLPAMSTKTLIMAGAGGGGLLVLFLFAAFIWPGFWRSGGAEAGLRYLPPDSSFIAGVYYPAFNSASFKKQIQNLGIGEKKGAKDGPPRELLQDVDWILFGHSEGDDFGLVVQKNRSTDMNAFRRKAKFGPATKPAAEQYKDKTVYSSREGQLLYLPTSTLFVIYRGSHSDAPYYPGLSDHDPNKMTPEMIAAVRRFKNNGIWFVATPESEIAKGLKMMVSGSVPIIIKKGKKTPPPDDDDTKSDDSGKDGKEVRLAFKNSKLITFAANPTSDGKVLQGDLTFECASEGDAQKLEKAFTSAKEPLAGMFGMMTSPLFAPTPKLQEKLMGELKDSLTFKVSGSKLAITMKLGEAVWEGLKTYQEEREKAEKEED